MRHSILFIFLCWSWNISAQLNGKYTFRHIDQSDGLLHTIVRGIGQDERGFIWILTWNGLQRYDGSRFVNYPQIINQSSFGVFHDSELYVDTLDNQIWITKGDRMEILDLSSGKMTTMLLEDFMANKSISKAELFKYDDQYQWLSSEYGQIGYRNKDNLTMSSFNINPGKQGRNTFIIKDPDSGGLWTNDFYHLLLLDHKTKTALSSGDAKPAHPLLAQLKKLYPDGSRLRFIMLDSERNIWISTWGHWLHRYNMDSKILKTYSLKEIIKRQKGDYSGDNTMLIHAIYEDRQKNIWFGTDYAGLVLYDKEKDDFDFITSDDKISNGIKYNYSIYSIFQDREDNIWLGTDRGISIFNPYRNYFQSIRHVDGDPNSLPKFDINDVIETSKGELLIGTWGGGISVYDRKWNFIRNIVFPGSVEHNLVWSFIQNDDGNIWAGAQRGYIHIYDPVKHTIATIQPPELNNSTISTMVKDKEGNILVGLFNGQIAVYKKNDGKFHAYDEADSKTSFKHQRVVSILIDHSNQCWVTTEAALKEFDIDHFVYTDQYQPDKIDPVSGITAQGIEELNDSTLVIGTSYEGIYLFNKNTKEFARPVADLQLDLKSVYAIKKDHSGHLWFTTNFSLYKMNSQLTDFTRFNIDHTVTNAAFGSNHFYEMKDGRWITTTSAEIMCFHPEKIGADYTNPLKVEFSAFKVLDDELYIDSFLHKKKTVILPYDKNFFSIEFTALDITSVQEVNYYYRLSDIDKNWIHSTTKAFADYTDVKPGEYLFEVKADNGNGSSAISSLAIVITPPWWGTLWFRLLALLVLGSLIYLILKKRILAIRKESELKQRVVEMEMMALRSQMNPHFIFNCINSIDAMIQSNDKYRATVYLNKFAKLIRNVLDSSKENKVPLSKDMETLQLYIDLELFRHQDKFTATVHADEELMQNDYKVPPLIIQPYVENAILHGLRQRSDHAGKLNVTVTKEGDHIVYIIEDNGVGRKTNNGESKRDGQGYGMQMSDDRIRLFNDEEIASVQVTDLKSEGQPSGTRIRVQLKMQ